MKKNIYNAFLIFAFSLASVCTLQGQEIEPLVSKISNKDIYIVLLKTLAPRIKGAEAKQIVRIGKPATSYLIQVLEDRNKGIAAHFILSEIWKETWTEEMCCNIEYKGNLEIMTINGLEICFDDAIMFATAESLRNNKLAWEKITKV